MCDEFDIDRIQWVNTWCRENKKSVGLIVCGVIGLMVYSFVDFGNGFKIYDKDGLDYSPFLIESITKS